MEAASLNKTKNRIKQNEGCVLKIYDDPLLGSKAPTIFYGHLVVSSDAWQPGIYYSMEQAEAVFEEDFAVAEECANKFIGDVIIPDSVRSIIIEISYNIGEPRLFTFEKMRQAIKNKDFEEAAEELKDSKLYRQLKHRYDPLIDEMRNAE